MLTWPCKWDRSSLCRSCPTRLDWFTCRIDRSVPVATTCSVLVQKAVLTIGTLSFLMSCWWICLLLSCLSARGYLTVFVFKRLKFVFGLLKLEGNPALYLVLERWIFWKMPISHTCIQISSDWQYFLIISKVIQIWMQEVLCPSHALTSCPGLIMEWVIPEDGFQPKRKSLFLCSVLMSLHASYSTETFSVCVNR